MRIHLAGVIFKVSSISRVRSEDEHCHYGAAALTRNALALDHFLGFRRAGRQIDRSGVFTSSAHNPFHLACQFEPKGLKIAARCVVIGSDGSPTTSQEIWQRPSSNSCSKMRPISPSRRCRNTYAQALERRCFSKDTSGGN